VHDLSHFCCLVDIHSYAESDLSAKVTQANALQHNADLSSLVQQEYRSQALNIEVMTCPLREWIAQTRTRCEIKHRFRQFLLTYESPKGVHVYVEQIREMCASNKASIEISYPQLSAAVPILAMWTIDAPRDVLEIFDEVASELILSSDHFPCYENIMREVHVRIVKLPILDSIQVLRRVHQNKLIRVCGVVTRRSSTYPQLKLAKYTCLACHALLGPFSQNAEEEVNPSIACSVRT